MLSANTNMKVVKMINEVLTFWFQESGPEQWFAKDDMFDKKISNKFLAVYEALVAGAYEDWRLSSQGCLAEIIVLDQLSRNMFRGDPKAFAADSQALECANYAISMAYDRDFSQTERNFLYLPFEHSENMVDQEKSIHYFTENGDENTLDYAIKHKKVIDRFGRYPHRNDVLGRASTDEELAFLKEPGSTF